MSYKVYNFDCSSMMALGLCTCDHLPFGEFHEGPTNCVHHLDRLFDQCFFATRYVSPERVLETDIEKVMQLISQSPEIKKVTKRTEEVSNKVMRPKLPIKKRNISQKKAKSRDLFSSRRNRVHLFRIAESVDRLGGRGWDEEKSRHVFSHLITMPQFEKLSFDDLQTVLETYYIPHRK